MPATFGYRSQVLPPRSAYEPGEDNTGCSEENLKWVMVATILGSGLAFMDGSIVNVAMPTLQTDFGATSSAIQWVVQSYTLFSAALLLLGGTLGDRYGRRRIFFWGVALFAIASAGCAAASTLGLLVAARAVQGIGAAMLIPQGLSILSVSYPEKRRAKAIGTWSAWTSVFAALGPVVGGWLVQAWSWRLIFVLNLPIALTVLVMTRRIPESKANGKDGKPVPLDRLGATLATVGFAAVIYALSFAPEFGWDDARVLSLLGVGGALLAGFLWSQAGRVGAMMPLGLFRIPRFLAPNLLTFLLYGALYGSLYVTPFYLIQVRHYKPAMAGAVFLPLIALMFLFSTWAGGMVAKVGERLLLCAGAGLAGAGYVAFAVFDRNETYVTGVLPGVLLLGAGLTLSVAPLTSAVMSSVSESEAGVASAVNNAISRLAGLLAVSLLSIVLAHGFGAALARQLHQSDLPGDVQKTMLASQGRLHDTPIPASLPAEQRVKAEGMLDTSFLAGFRLVMLFCAGGAWLGALAVALLLKEGDRPGVSPVAPVAGT
ncbi:drug resistance transporter, EmrB/QacA subfamily [Granulicella pectinivorans]|uniref:Drug resistance transporter, EmrB/QacA subfamily n=1 Tax=Granulicella pectinivorans TaxID=474950 RepID=A0A1I6MPU9_9BACT|nr:MFS transporter [Granulicella pectinivorans]SFS17674.1 drug resistance transporter, EmrB/QacA subfamily [Granulicella pectinivorans]